MLPPTFAASLMCARLEALAEDVVGLEGAGIDAHHIDVMDGHFVPNLALSPTVARAIRGIAASPIHVHLMVENAEDYLPDLADAGADVVFFHLEATRFPIRLARRAADLGLTPGLALNPSTPLPTTRELLDLPHVLVMAVEPGFAGQLFISSTVDRVARLRERVPDGVTIHVDGHIDAATAPSLWLAGARGFVLGTSGLFTGPGADFAANLAVLRASIQVADPR